MIREEKGNPDCIPPCSTCWPPAMEGNQKLVRAFFFAMAHKRYSQGQFIGLDMNFVVKVLEVVKIEDKDKALENIMNLTKEFLFKDMEKKVNAF